MSIDENIYVFVVCPLACLSFILILINTLVLARLQHSAKIFVYLLHESIFVLLDCLISAFLPLFKCPTCFATHRLPPILVCLLNYVAFNFICDLFEQVSIVLATFASFTCLFMFDAGSNSSPFWWSLLNRVHPIWISIVTTVLLTLNSGYHFFMFKIDLVNSTRTNSSVYECVKNPIFDESSVIRAWGGFSFGLTYGLMLVVIVGVNLAIVIKVRRELGGENISDAMKSVATKRKATEKKLTLLVLIECANIVAGRLPMMTFFLLQILGVIRFSYASFCLIPIFLSFSLKFFIFIKFNSRFRIETNKLLSEFIAVFNKFFKRL